MGQERAQRSVRPMVKPSKSYPRQNGDVSNGMQSDEVIALASEIDRKFDCSPKNCRPNQLCARQAYDAFLRALKIDESHHTALANAAHAAASFGDHPEALILIDTALAKSPASIPHLLRKTWILLRKGDQEAAERLLSKLMGRYPDLLLQPPGSRSEAQLRQELAGFVDARAPD